MGKKKGPKFYQTPEFKKLYEKWVGGKKGAGSELERSGFIDIEYPNASSTVLKTRHRNHRYLLERTQSYGQRDELQRISSALTFYIEHQEIELTYLERKILELHSQGAYRKQIMKLTGKSHSTVWRIVKKHIPLALGLQRDEQESDTLSSLCRDDEFDLRS